MKIEPKHIVLVIALMAGLLMSVFTATFAYSTNEGFGFPLDDPWIHLQFAKNLHDYGSFSYYKNEMVTSGSTAPLYTIILALGFFVTSNEMILSYALGVGFFLVGAVYLFLIAEKLLRFGIESAIAAMLLFLLEPRLQWIALSGMETTLFIALLLAVVYYYLAKRPVALGVSAGLLVWTRPEAVILFGVIATYKVYENFIAKRKSAESNEPVFSGRLLGLAVLIMAAFGIGYMAFNLLLSGSVLPNTYAAKIKYYAAGGENFPEQVFLFLTSGIHMVLAPFLGVGVLAVLADLIRRKHSLFVVPLMFSVAMFAAYWMKLPYLYQNGRYLMPILPFVILIGVYGIEVTFSFLIPRVSFLAGARTLQQAQWLVYGICVIAFGYGSWEGRLLYQDYCKYISDRQVRTAFWIRDHLPKDAVVATHDVGAIAYYSERRIVDMVGLVSPEMIDRIGDIGKMKSYLVAHKTTHLAVLRSWFEIVNVNALFQTNEGAPEIAEVFEFDPEKIHLTSKRVNYLTDTAWRFLVQGNAQQGGLYAENAVQADPNSSRAHHHFAWALMMVGRYEQAEQELRKALEIHPTYWRAYFALAQIPLRQGNTKEGIARLEHLIEMAPSMLIATQQLGQIFEQLGDSAKAKKYMDLYEKGMDPQGK